MIELESVDLKIYGNETTGYTVEVVGPGGERASAPFAWTVATTDLEAIQMGTADRAILERVGTALFQALFPMDIVMVYVAVKAQLEENEGLRLRLHLPPELARLPWELLYYPPFFLSTDPRSPVVRFLDLPDTPRPLIVQPPLRLLHLVASPADASPLEVDRETALLRSAITDLTARGMVEIVPDQRGTLTTLRDGLRQGCHVLHFSGHGGLSEQTGYLLFEDDDGLGQPVDGDTLAHLLRGTNVRLAFLNACESASATDSDAFGSVAAALIRAGLPAVIAHQYPLPDGSALAFAAEFYRALSVGYPVDAAVSEGRKAILSALGTAWRDRVDWATPVLFMRAPDGRVLAMQEGEEGTATPPTSPTVQQTTTIDSISGGTVSIGTVNIGLGAPQAAAQASDRSPADELLPDLLDELRQAVRDYAPETKRVQALEKVAALRGAAAGTCPDLALIEGVLKWFEAELPQLSGAVLSTILRGVAPQAEAAGDEVLVEFRERFGALE